MTTYIKICPRCGHENHEFADACEIDGEFLGIVPAVPAPEKSEEKKVPEPLPEKPSIEKTPGTLSLGDIPVTERFEKPTQALYLETSIGQTYEVPPGGVLGQTHPSSSAQVQLNDIPGVNYVHRSHCLFEYIDNGWRVTALPQPDYTNPTFVNSKRLEPGEQAPIRNGDKLTLSNITLNVRIISF
jgi:hypothetical protein